MRIMDRWESNLHSMGLEISTGPVIDFRTKHLCAKIMDRPNVVPLLWAQNVRNGLVKWPNGPSDKPEAIENRKETESILLPMSNYVIIKT